MSSRGVRRTATFRMLRIMKWRFFRFATVIQSFRTLCMIFFCQNGWDRDGRLNAKSLGPPRVRIMPAVSAISPPVGFIGRREPRSESFSHYLFRLAMGWHNFDLWSHRALLKVTFFLVHRSTFSLAHLQVPNLASWKFWALIEGTCGEFRKQMQLCGLTKAQKFAVDDNIFIEYSDRIVPGISILHNPITL